MELRLDRLLAKLRDGGEAILAAIDADPLLLKRTSGDLVLANASQLLYTPLEEHQLYAKGIVYRRDPYRLVSLPLIKIYNVGERNVTVPDLALLADEPGVRLRFLRKMDGSLVQVFRDGGRAWFTTRGWLEEANWPQEWGDDEDRGQEFDYVGEARRMAQLRYPRLLEDKDLLEGRTLLFELIHPRARKVTNYGELADLVLLGCFDHRRFAYLDHDEVRRLGEAHGLNVVAPLSPAGDGLAGQIDHLLSSWAGTDEEGAVLCFERPGEVVYRVKVKSPEYLQLMRLMAFCTYERTVEFLDARPHVRSWEELEAALQEQGNDRVPEEVLVFYRQHWDRFRRYLAGLERLRAWAEAARENAEAEAGGRAGRDAGAFRKAFAAVAVKAPYPGLLFAALDGRLDTGKLRKMFPNERDVAEALQRLGLESPG
jgi:hypothetical protein